MEMDVVKNLKTLPCSHNYLKIKIGWTSIWYAALKAILFDHVEKSW